jgi:hypothetical protein
LGHEERTSDVYGKDLLENIDWDFVQLMAFWWCPRRLVNPSVVHQDGWYTEIVGAA